MSLGPVEDDLYGSNSTTQACCSLRGEPLPRGHWATQEEIYRFWRMTLRPARNDRCNALEIGRDIYFMASVTAKDYETCTVAPHPALQQSHVVLCAEDGIYEFTPRRPLAEPFSQQPVTLVIGLGENPVAAAETRVPEEFNPLLPFHVTQTRDYFYISQGLNTRVILRVDKTLPHWENRFRKYLTVSFSGLLFNVRYTESPKVEVRCPSSLK